MFILVCFELEVLLENKLDMAILDVIENPKQFVTAKLYEDDMLVVCNPDFYDNDEITLKELGKHPPLLPPGKGHKLA